MRKMVGIACILMLATFCGFEIYHQTGMVHATKKNGFGCICHSFDPTPSVRVWISGPDTLRAGTEATYSMNVARTGNIGAGFNVAAYFGSLGIVDSVGTFLERESSTDSLELTHRFTRLRSGRDTISWLFKYKAPLTVGQIDTLYSAGNAVNNDTLPDGDFWNFGENLLVRVTGTSSVADEPLAHTYRLLQNYPNPFNPSTIIRYEIPVEAEVKLTIFDATGREVGTIVNSLQSAGVHEVSFGAENIRQMASGVYLYRLTANPVRKSSAKQFVDARKMLLLK